MFRQLLPSAAGFARSITLSGGISTPRFQRFFGSRAPSFNSYFHWASQELASVKPEQRILAWQSDIAGSLVNPYCTLPLTILDELFLEHFKQKLTPQQIVGPMGMKKIEHIRHLLNELDIPGDELADKLHAEFTARLRVKIADPEFTQLIPHTEKFVRFLKQQHLKFATSSGYDRDSADLALSEFFRRLGKAVVDASSTPCEVLLGERSEMIHRNLDHMRIKRELAHLTIVASDAPSDFKSILKAANKRPGHTPWLIGLPTYSTLNCIISNKHAATLTPNELQQRRTQAAAELGQYTNFVCTNVIELLQALVTCQRAIVLGKKPIQHVGAELVLTKLALEKPDLTAAPSTTHTDTIRRTP